MKSVETCKAPLIPPMKWDGPDQIVLRFDIGIDEYLDFAYVPKTRAIYLRKAERSRLLLN